MLKEGLQVVGLENDFYRDSFGKVIFVIASVFIAIILLVVLSLYIHLSKPPPVTFAVADDWRVLPSVPLDQPYLTTPDLSQWVSDTIRRVFVYDFYHYNDQLKEASPYFTPDGWKVFLGHLNTYANYNDVQTNKRFVSAAPAGAPFILKQGLLSGRYAWWMQMPVNIYYANYDRSSTQTITLQILVVRVSTMNNLSGVGIENVLVVKGAGSSQIGTTETTGTT